MKVTKNVKEYIESEVKEIYSNKIETINQQLKEYDEEYKKLEDYIVEETKKINNKLFETLSKNPLFNMDDDNYNHKIIERSFNDNYTRYNKFYNNLEEEKRKLNKAIIKESGRIVAIMELGGNREELKELLQELKKSIDKEN